MDLENSPSFQEFLKLLNENGRAVQGQDLSLMAWYLDGMERQFDAVLKELQKVKAELAQVTEQQAPSKPILTKMVDALEAKVEQARERLVSFRDKIMEGAKDAVDRFKDAGVSALDNAVAAMGVKKGLEHLQEGLQNSLSGIKEALGKAEEMGTQLRRGFRNIANVDNIHTHIEFNSTNLNCDGKFVNPLNSYLILRRLNDELCRAHGLSVIEQPKARTKPEGEAAAIKYGVSFKEQLRQTIDRVIPDCRDYDDFLAKMRAEGYEIKEGKQLSFRAPGQERFTRSYRLGADYTKEALRERSTTRRGYAAAAKKSVQRTGRKINLLIDIQAKMAAGKGAGYERWAKIFNLKEAAKTLNFLIENGLTDYDELAARAEQAGTRFDETSRRIKQLEARMAEVAQLKTHIINYSKTREIYAAYKKSRHKKEFLTEHGDEIAKHEAAKRAFDALGGKPIPKVAQLSEEYASLLAEKQEQYAEYRTLRQDMIDYRTMKQNVDKILGLEPMEQEQQKEQKSER